MKILHLCLLLSGFIPAAFGQVSGRLTTATGQPIPFANVLLLKSSDSSLVKAALTDEKGAYRIAPVTPGQYLLRYSNIGYQVFTSAPFILSAAQPQKDAGTLVLAEDTRQLGEVVVRAEKPLFQPRTDGMVVNVQNSLLTKGSSALNVLERSPGVMIDYRNNGIMLNGKSGVMVMINGKLIRMSMDQVVSLLSSMSADNIEKIELLTTPGSRYDADGSAGMINIVLKKDQRQGTHGSFSVIGGYGWRQKGTAGINLAHNTKRTNLYGSYTYSMNKSYSDLYITSAQNMPVLGGRMEVISWDTTHQVQHNHDVTVGIDHQLNDKTTLGANVAYNSSRSGFTTVTNAGYNVLPDSLLQYNGLVNGRNRWQNLISSIYLEKKLRAGEQLNLDVDYLYFNNNNPSEVFSQFVNEHGVRAGENDSLFAPLQRGFANTTIQVGVAKADYSRQLNAAIKLEAGIKGTYTRSTSTSRIESLINDKWVNRSETLNDILMKESIGAAYTSVNVQLNPATSLVAGLRYEYAHTRIDNPQTGENTLNRKLGVLFPNISLSRKLGEDAELQLAYNKRISRPSYNDLASYVIYSDPTAVYTGNPFLRPTISHNIKLGYNNKGYTFSLLFSRDNDPIIRYQISQTAAANLLYISPQNMAYLNSVAFQANVPVKVNDWWSMSYSLTSALYNYKVVHTLQPVTQTYLGYSFNFSETFQLPKRFSAELSGWYNARSYNGSVKVDGFGAINAGIKKELNNNAGSLQLSVTDVLRSFSIHTRYGTLTREAFDIVNDVFIHTESTVRPVFRLTYARSFGGSGLKSTARKEGGAKDERDRIRKE